RLVDLDGQLPHLVVQVVEQDRYVTALQAERRPGRSDPADAPTEAGIRPGRVDLEHGRHPAVRAGQHGQRLVVALEADVRDTQRRPAAAWCQHDVAAVEALVPPRARGDVDGDVRTRAR